MKITALIVAAGRGHRAASQAGGPPKQFRVLHGGDESGDMVLTRTLRQFAAHPAISAIMTVVHPDDEELYLGAVAPLTPAHLSKADSYAFGGATRSASVLNGLRALKNQSAKNQGAGDLVLIHDAARPFVSAKIIDDVIAALKTHDAALPVLDVTDTIKQITPDGLQTLDRQQLKRAQTPQGFVFAKILTAHEQAAKTGMTATDDAALAEQAGLSIALVAGDAANIKLTMPQDFYTSSNMETHTATGFDVHKFSADKATSVTLGGIEIAHSHRLIGHSDADVALHALTDALLGCVSAGDIGMHFPPSDPAHKNRDSADFLTFAVEKIAAAGGRITHLDLTLICEAPKIAPHRTAMQARIAALCGVAEKRVSVKATTTEGLGFTGRGEGIAAQAIASVSLPFSNLAFSNLASNQEQK